MLPPFRSEGTAHTDGDLLLQRTKVSDGKETDNDDDVKKEPPSGKDEGGPSDAPPQEV